MAKFLKNSIFTTQKTFPMISFSRLLKNYCFILLFFVIPFHMYAQNPVQEGQWYVIQSCKKQLVIQTQPPFQNNGMAVILGRYNTKDNSLFKFEAAGNGYYIIRSKQNNKVLDIRGGSQENNAVLQMWDQANVENQKFKLSRATSDELYYITAKHSNKSIAAGPGFKIGSTVTQKYGDGLSNAMFKFIPHNPKKEKPKPKPVVNIAIPKLITPVTGQVIENKKGNIINFKWSKVPNATKYQLYVEHSNKKDKLLNNIFKDNYYDLTLSETLPTTLAKGAWGWWVRAQVGNKWSKWSKPNTIYFKESVKTTITLNSPQSNASLANGIESRNASFSWDFDWEDVPNAEQYEIVIIHPNNNKKSILKNTPVSRYQLVQRGGLKNNELIGWKWKVRAFINGSYRDWSATRTFNVKQAKKQSTPVNPPPVVTDNLTTQSTANFNKAVKNNFAVELKNKINNRSTSLGYNVQKDHFKMGDFFKNWRIKYVRNGIYQLQVEIDGKFWSLASKGAEKGDVKLAVDNRNDAYQLWKIEQQTDGYYKITNIGNQNNPIVDAEALFYDTKNHDFFLTIWKPERSLNGRWYFDAKKTVNIKPKPIEDRIFRMNASNGKRVCLAYIMTSDATGYNSLRFCSKYNSNNTLFKFERTTNGNYLIKVKSTDLGENKWYYLSSNMELYEIDKNKDIPIKNEYGMYWAIMSKGNGNYTIFNVDDRKALEYVKRPYSSPRELIELRKLANKYEQYFKLY
ncbi:hypothetical protein KAOT1_01420 [Kordia algicida OT-1]|uniref:Ricin B lectin domain-containing protein n=2 Tax=Kordia TaxID=221065 RepID=A9E912_9FLAO|nr:hypothetical protein KAOT1_01420 [Kordia algicida OT-1]